MYLLTDLKNKIFLFLFLHINCRGARFCVPSSGADDVTAHAGASLGSTGGGAQSLSGASSVIPLNRSPTHTLTQPVALKP